MSTLQNSLHCLRHPITLLSIALLLVNDHILKVVSPSWLTGKLSDFAGLFFFPFLLAILLGLLFRRASQKTIGWLAFGITAIWFTLIKTTGWGNTLTEELVSRLLGVPVQIVLDPTDLIALVVLYPAWRLWNRAEQVRPTRLGWIALGVASVATLATTPLPPPPAVTNLLYDDGKVYANSSPFALSEDGGKTWAAVKIAPPFEGQWRKMPLIICEPFISQLCYRIAGNEQVEQSEDSGQNWHVVWSIPPGRREYMKRAFECDSISIAPCSKELQLGPYDMLLSNPVGQNGQHTLIVALGTNGVLVRDPIGKWEMTPVLSIVPVQFAAQDFSQAQKVSKIEAYVWLIITIIILTGLSIFSARVLLPESNDESYNYGSSERAIRPLVIAIPFALGLFLIACLASAYLTGGSDIRACYALAQ